jgi:hypothetical protein
LKPDGGVGSLRGRLELDWITDLRTGSSDRLTNPTPPFSRSTGMIGQNRAGKVDKSVNRGPTKPLLPLRRLPLLRQSSGSIPRRQTERGIKRTDHSLVMARVRQERRSSLINSVISNQPKVAVMGARVHDFIPGRPLSRQHGVHLKARTGNPSVVNRSGQNGYPV